VQLAKLLFILLITASVVALHVFLAPYAYDDAYIHFRIVRNFIDYGLPYFNPSEPVMGSSSPVWILVLRSVSETVGLISSRSVSETAAVLNGLVSVCASIIWTKIIFRDSQNKSLFLEFFAFVSILSFLWQSSFGLMETPLAVLFLGTGLLIYEKRRGLSFGFVTLAAFTRPEYTIALLILILISILRKELSVKLLASILAVAILPIIFCLHFYGTLIPHPILAKSVVYDLSLREFIQLFFNQLLSEEINSTYRFIAPIYLILIVACLVVITFSRRPKNERLAMTRIELLSLSTAIVITITYAARLALIFPWYLPLILVPLFSTVLSTVLSLRRSSNNPSLLFLAALISMPCILVFITDLTSITLNSKPFTLYSQGLRVEKYREIGKGLYAKAPNATVLSPEIGGLGFEFKGRVIDALGLVTPLALEFHPLDIPNERKSGLIGSIPPKLVEATQPDYIVALEIFAEAFLQSDTSNLYTTTYIPIGSQLWQSTRIILSQRRSVSLTKINQQ